MIDRDLLQAFVATFYGYGTWNAPFWFVGMEEAGVETLADFERRLQAWIDEGKPSLVDLKRFHERIGFGASLSESAPLQPTWRPLIRAVQVATNKDTSVATLREYQANHLGRDDGETALIELLPLPSSDTNKWPYESIRIEGFATRKEYTKTLTPRRVAGLLDHIDRHKPRAVVFYGNPAFWREKVQLAPVAPHIWSRRHDATLLIATRHPAARGGSSNAHWDSIGRLIGEAARS